MMNRVALRQPAAEFDLEYGDHACPIGTAISVASAVISRVPTAHSGPLRPSH